MSMTRENARLLTLVGCAAVALAGGCSSSSPISPPTDGGGGGGGGGRTGTGGTPAIDASADVADALDATDATDVGEVSDAPTTPSCVLGDTYRFGDNGGFRGSVPESTLTPPASYRHTSTPVSLPEAPVLSCAPALPACGAATLVDVSDIMRDLADPDVVQALSQTTPPLYGYDQRPVDGTMFQVLRADGHGFLAGAFCDTGAFCHGVVPLGIARFVTDLKALDQQQLGDPTCANIP
jgi:hypothetical protein